MKHRYLEVTFRKGKPLAAYLYLPHKNQSCSIRTEEKKNGILVDYEEDGDPIGVEITAPAEVSLEELNSVLGELGVQPLEPQDIEPLRVA